MAQKFLLQDEADVASIVEYTLGCRWMLSLLQALANGKHRPGVLQKSLRDSKGGISSKVLNQRLAELVHFGLVCRRVMDCTPNGTPSHVEYHYTEFGTQFLKIVSSMSEVQAWKNSAMQEKT